MAANVGGSENGQVVVSATVSHAGRGRVGLRDLPLDVNAPPANIFFAILHHGWFVLPVGFY